MVTSAELLDALAPLPQATQFPYPTLVQSSGPGGSFTYEGPTINGVPMPGQWLLTRCPRVYGWQKQQPTFMTGGYLVPTGDPFAEIEYSVRIWESGTAGVFRQLLRTLLKKPVLSLPGVPASAALGIDDPSLKDVGITQVVVAAVTPLINPLVTSGGRGPWTATVGFIEWRPPVPAQPLPSQAIPDPGAVTPAASANMDTANAAVTAGAATMQANAARSLLGG